VICLPNDDIANEIDLPPDVRALVWSGEGDPPDGIEDTEFLVGDYMGGTPAQRALAQMPRLQVIQLLSAGVEPWLRLVPDGVTLCNGRGVHGGSTAELATAGLLSLLRELPHFHDEQRAARWSPSQSEDLDGKRVLILGAGDIGQRVARAVGVFDATCTFVARTARDGVHAIGELPDLLPETDIVLVALPHTDETHHLVDAPFLSALPDGAILVNVSRGAIVDTDALLGELQARRLSAFLDVVDPEPLPADHPLWQAPNVLITPHVGGGTSGWRRRGYRLVSEQLRRFVAGEQLVNVVGDSY
jgi:phosphoglycerate dehydrogenase-like enzyme